MTNQESSYRQIFKATGIFGGVQVFNILISIAKSKIIAILLGPAGIGLFGVLNSTLDVLKSVTSLGIGMSGVKEVSEAAGTEDTNRISQVLKALHRWMYITGSFGCIITIVMAPWLSKWTFGDDSYTWAFYWLSVVLFFNALNAGQSAALQGLRQIGFLAKAGLLGSFIGLCISIPLFYLFHYKGVVFSIIASSVCALFFSAFYARRIPLSSAQQSFDETYRRGVGMAKLGIALMFSSLLSFLASYILKAYITREGSIEDVGIYQSAFAIAEGYFGLIFMAMATDYYPRLAAVNSDNTKMGGEVNKQAEIGLLIAFPCIVIALFFMPIGIRLLYSEKFLGAVECINWAMMGNLFKIGSWTMGYVLIAKGKSKIFTATAIGFNAIYLLLTIYGYRFAGITGVGMGYLLYYILHFVGIYFICSYWFHIRYQKEFRYLFIAILIIASAAFYLQTVENGWIKYGAAALLCATSLFISYKQLDKRMQLRQFIANKLHKK